MTKDELLALLANAKTVIISVVGRVFTIKSWGNGKYSIDDRNSFLTYSSPQDLVENHTIMNMSLESLTPWMHVTAVA